MPGAFDDINFPEDVGNQKADLKEQEVADAAAKEAAVESADVKPETPPSTDPPKEEQNAADNQAASDSSEKPEEKPSQDAANDSAEKDKQTLTPFHEHPDWKKMVERVRVAEESAANAQRAAAEARAESQKAAPVPDEYSGMSVEEIAKKKMEDKVKGGWEPKDQVEVSLAANKIMDEARQIVSAREEKQRQESAAEGQRMVDSKLDELKITDKGERTKVTELVRQWVKDGMSISIHTFDVAAEHLRLKGEIGQGQADSQTSQPPAAQTPAENSEQKQKEAAAKEARDAANRRISHSKPSGEPNQKPKISYKDLRSKDLDTIVAEAAARMG